MLNTFCSDLLKYMLKHILLHLILKILIDNGHGIQTKGKRSPDGKLLEYAYTREIAKRVVANLIDRGYDSELLVPEEDDIPLSERVKRVNATCLYKAAEQILKNRVIRTDYARDGDPDWEENFYLLRKTLCPAVLTENFFMDSRSDQDYLLSEAGKQAVVNTHVEGITKYLSLCPTDHSL